MTQLTTPDGSDAGRFAFGAMQFGGKADEAASRAMYDAAREAGIRHFDTAWIYNDGQSETLLGKMIAAERDALFIATKVAYAGQADRTNIQARLDECRQRLQLDMVDLLYIHRFDPDTPLDVTMEALADLKAQGQIRYAGLSNFAAWQVMKAHAIAPVDVLQPMYNLVKRQAEVEILPMCADQGISVFPYSPLGGGLLTGKYGQGASGRLVDNKQYATRYGQDWMHKTASALNALAAETGTHPATLAVAWVAAHPTAPCPILSARNVDQLRPSLDAITFRMDKALYDRISALSPTPPPATDRTEEQG